MARITRVEGLMVDLKPKVKRVDAIQSFVSQETPIIRITDADGAVGTGYSYTIGTGGHAVVELLARNLAPQLIGRDPDEIEAIWKALFFHTHATAVGAITALALAAIDTALWDLKARKLGLPLHLLRRQRLRRVRRHDGRQLITCRHKNGRAYPPAAALASAWASYSQSTAVATLQHCCWCKEDVVGQSFNCGCLLGLCRLPTPSPLDTFTGCLNSWLHEAGS